MYKSHSKWIFYNEFYLLTRPGCVLIKIDDTCKQPPHRFVYLITISPLYSRYISPRGNEPHGGSSEGEGASFSASKCVKLVDKHVTSRLETHRKKTKLELL